LEIIPYSAGSSAQAADLAGLIGMHLRHENHNVEHPNEEPEKSETEDVINKWTFTTSAVVKTPTVIHKICG